MYDTVVREGLSFGEAMHEAVVNENYVSRPHWGGYWYNEVNIQPETYFFTTPILVAVLKDGKSLVPATPYNEDIQARDWIVVDDVTFPQF